MCNYPPDPPDSQEDVGSKIEKLLSGVSSLMIFRSPLAPDMFPGVRFITPHFRQWWLLTFEVFYQGSFFRQWRSI